MNLNDLWNSKLTWTVVLVFICLWVHLYYSKKKNNQLNLTTSCNKGFEEKKKNHKQDCMVAQVEHAFEELKCSATSTDLQLPWIIKTYIFPLLE